ALAKEHSMAVTRSVATRATKTTNQSSREGVTLGTFVWEGTDKRGKKMKGEQLAKNVNMLRAALRRQGITPRMVKPKPKPLFGSAGSAITAQDIALCSRQIATMIKSGVPVVQALESIGSGHKNPRVQKLINAVRNDVENGPSIYEAMSK